MILESGCHRSRVSGTNCLALPLFNPVTRVYPFLFRNHSPSSNIAKDVIVYKPIKHAADDRIKVCEEQIAATNTNEVRIVRDKVFSTMRCAKRIKSAAYDVKIKAYAQFAVMEQNKKENEHFEFVKVVGADFVKVSGTIYYITIEAMHAGKTRKYLAAVWVQPWLKFMCLQKWVPIEDVLSNLLHELR